MRLPPFLKTICKKLLWVYESKIAPFIAKHCYLLYAPIAKYCKRKKIIFVVNIASGTGHILCELDYFFTTFNEEINKDFHRYIWLRKSDDFSKACAQLYGKNFHKTYCSYFLHALFLPMLMAYKEMTVDFGLSRLKWQLRDDRSYDRPPQNESYLYQISKLSNFENWKKYFIVRKKNRFFLPLAKNLPEETHVNSLFKNKKLALLHIKETVCNATALQTDPHTYGKAIEHLLNQGYELVFFGREKMPEFFKEFPIYNYAESKLATFPNDIFLTSMSHLVLCGGSGIAYLPDCLGKYFLMVNSWHLPLPQPSEKCIYIPTLVSDKQGNKLSFAEQFHLYSNAEDKGAEIFPFDEFTPRNASSDEILEGIRELIMLSQKQSPWTENQIRFRNIGFPYPSYYAESRVSEYFLQKHSDRF